METSSFPMESISHKKHEKTLKTYSQEINDTMYLSEVKDFNPASYYLHITDTSAFLRKVDLLQFAKEYNDTASVFPENWIYGKILSFQKKNIYGSKHKVYILFFEFYGASTSSSSPQVICIFNNSGKQLLYQNHCEELKMLTIFKGQAPFILTTEESGFGNGTHHVYMYRRGRIEDVLKGKFPNTIDKHEDDSVYDPYHMNIEVEDLNKDGYNDLLFSSTLMMLCNQKIPSRKIRFDFTFRPTEQIFHTVKDYSWEEYHPECK